MSDDNKNFLTFAIIAALILFGWPYAMSWLMPTANRPVPQANTVAAPATPGERAAPGGSAPAPGATVIRDRNVVLKESAANRVRIETPRLNGSINLKGARIDDLVLLNYKDSIKQDAKPVRLLSPSGTQDAYFAGFGWQDNGLKPPAADTIWTPSAPVLSVGKPVTLSASNAQGQTFRIEFSIDDAYMFTVRQTVQNGGAAPVPVAAYGLVNRTGIFAEPDTWTVQIGPMAVYEGKADYEINWGVVDEGPKTFATTGGWLGFTDKYWLTALVPDQAARFDGQFRAGPGTSATRAYQADYALTPKLLAPGQSVTQSARFFAGAKEVKLLDRYTDKEGIKLFDYAIDWGWFRIVEKPIFYYLHWLFELAGNFGVAIILLTVTIRGLLYPIAQRQFASMAAMRAIQPKMQALQERYKDDKPRMQQEIMALYKTEKVNPLAGCLPTFLQIPILYALYKVLLLTIEMRHQPFVLWIKDLSAPDPLTPVNLFGLLPFTPPAFLAIGVIPILLGISMYVQFKLNPAPQDEVQKQVFAIMPWMLMIIMAPFAAGLQLYWITSNVLTIIQQKILYAKHPALKAAPAK